MPTRVAVVIPGIMGSALFYEEGPDQRDEIWGENFFTNYKRLLDNSTMLRWNGTPAESSLLQNIYFSRTIPLLPKYRLWDGVLQHLYRHPEFGKGDNTLLYSYDWRQSLLKTAEHLGKRLDEHAQNLDSSDEELRYVFFTHSMGGLVLRIALALGVLDSSRVGKIVHIGSPLEGAPVAFRSAYKSGSLPLLQELSHLFRGTKNAPRFFEHLLDNVRTFDSIYQLMPPVGHDYLFYTPTHKSNPLAEEFMPQNKRALADQAHGLLREAKRMISDGGIEAFTIYGEWHQDATDLEYRVQQLGAPNPGYEITQSHGVTHDGDGTVPKWSAAGNSTSCKQNLLMNVAHATMCNNRKVVRLLSGILAC